MGTTKRTYCSCLYVFLALIVSIRHILGYYRDRRYQHLYAYMYVWDVYRYCCYYCRTVESIVTYSSTIASFKEKIRFGQLVGARTFRHGCPRSASSYIFRPRGEGVKERKTESEWGSQLLNECMQVCWENRKFREFLLEKIVCVLENFDRPKNCNIWNF